MGWDAYAFGIKRDWIKKRLRDPVLDKTFKEAEDFVRTAAGTVDGYLRLGGLDVSSCGRMLEKATGESCWVDGWSSDVVQRLNRTANWKFKYNEDEYWAYLSAKTFLECCAKHNLEITFSF